MSSTAGAIHRLDRPARRDGALRHLSAALSLSFLALIVITAIIFVARRLSGEWTRPLSSGPFLLITLAVLSALATCRRSILAQYLVRSTQYSVLGTIVRRAESLPRLFQPQSVVTLVVPSLAALAVLASLTTSERPPRTRSVGTLRWLAHACSRSRWAC